MIVMKMCRYMKDRDGDWSRLPFEWDCERHRSLNSFQRKHPSFWCDPLKTEYETEYTDEETQKEILEVWTVQENPDEHYS